MEGVHGVDISWLHHSHRDNQTQRANSLSSSEQIISATKQSPAVLVQREKSGREGSQTNGDDAAQSRHNTHIPHLHHRQSSEKATQYSQQPTQSPRDVRMQSSPSLSKKPSWITNISSKFSSSTGSQPSSPNAPLQFTKALPSPSKEQPNPVSNGTLTADRDIKKPEAQLAPPQSSPKSAPSFIQSALRRLSSSSGGVGLGKGAGAGGVCPRRVMNVDPYRQRPKIQDLQSVKLRRVAFCVDVEIAGAARYHDDESEEARSLPSSSVDSDSSPIQREDSAEAKSIGKKLKDQAEGKAFKNPHAVMESLEGSTNSVATKEDVLLDKGQIGPIPGHTSTKNSSRKKEKKKRSEEERKQRKERKKQEAVANGAVPKELSRESSSTEDSSPDALSDAKARDRPTTDPLRIYRRCCQLRETQILPKITQQLAPNTVCDAASPGTITCLDLSDYPMEFPDIVTLGDYLAVVPVKRLVLEKCGLTDAALKVILAGLLAVKTPEQAKHNKHLAKKAHCENREGVEQLGVVEKLSLKNNPKIGKDGWKYICSFVHLSRSLKAIDVSGIPIPQASRHSNSSRQMLINQESGDVCSILQNALAERVGGSKLEEVVMAECSLTSNHIEKIVDGVMQCGATRLGLANNKMNPEAIQHIARYIKTGKCEGLDLGGNDLSGSLDVLADALDANNPLYALSLADCNLSPSSLRTLFPALVRLSNFRFIDLSHNLNLFASQPNALTLLRKYLPQLKSLKRVHLADVAMSSEHAIALAEVLPECKNLAYLMILDNPQLTALASAKDEASQEEACALYASLMAAVRVSKSIVCIDIDVPSADSSEIVKALAKQVVAYSLRNMEHGPVAEAYASAAAAVTEPHGADRDVAVPDILLHLVGHVDGFPENHDLDPPAPDDDYIVGGTGVVKALGVCLGNRFADSRRDSRDITPGGSGTTTPKQTLSGTGVASGKAKDMSKNLLGSARKIRARLQPALVREAHGGNETNYTRLKFLDSTLKRMIQRFEDEYPECRIPPTKPEVFKSEVPHDPTSLRSSLKDPLHSNKAADDDFDPAEDDEQAVKSHMSRHNSDVSLASRFLTQEEGQMHRFGQQLRRDVLRSPDNTHPTTEDDGKAQHLQALRARLELMTGEELKQKVESLGATNVLQHLGTTAEELLHLEKQDPESFEKFREAQLTALLNREQPAEGPEEAVV